MSGDLIHPEQHFSGVLSDHYILESHLCSTRSADAYKAIDRKHNRGVCVWLLRHPLALNSDAVRRFCARMERIGELRLPNSPIQDFGVDSAGAAFSVFPMLDGNALTGSRQSEQSGGRHEISEAERRFVAVIRIIERLHQSGVACGDLCHHSFWIDRSGEVWLIGVMGSFDSEAVATSTLPPLETLHYVAPEQRSGGGLEPASDVFALGVLGYYLFTRHFPFGEGQALLTGNLDLAAVPALSSFGIMPPIWAEEVLQRCLNPAPEHRYPNASALAQAISETRQRVTSESALPVRTARDELAKHGQLTSGKAQLIRMTPNLPKSNDDVPKEKGLALFRGVATLNRTAKLRLLITVVAAFSISLVLAWKLIARQDTSGGGGVSDLSLHEAAISDNEPLKVAVEYMQEQKISLQEKAQKLEALVNSDDPLAHDVIVRMALEAPSLELRGMCEKAIVDRARRLGMLRSSEQMRQWLRTVSAEQLPPSYAPLLKALNTTIPAEARDGEVREAYATNPKIALRLGAALALDSEHIEQFQPLLSQLVGDALNLEDAPKHSALGLILGHPELALIFSEDVVQRRTELSDVDILWLLRLLADRNDFNVRTFASLAVDRGILSPLRQYFLKTVRDREDLPNEVTNALIHAAAGSLRVEDIGAFGRWVDTESGSLLLALAADTSDAGVLAETFEVVAGKSSSLVSSAGLIEWVRKNQWNKRGIFARAVGILSHTDKVSEDELRRAIETFHPHIKDNRLMNNLLDVKNPTVTKILIERYADLLPLGVLLNLLDHPDKGTRILAVRSLKPYHDVGALKILVDHYDKERNEEVRQAYKELWVIQNRE